MMNTEKGNTIKFIKDKRQVSPQSRENLKTFTRMKKLILSAFKEEAEMTIPQLSEKLKIPGSETVYYLMTLLKYGLIETVGLDDMDEYYIYKLKNDGKN